jgi:phage gp36-like protein
MTYCSRLDLEVAFGVKEIQELIDRNADGAEDNGALGAAIERAAGEIDARCRGRYAIPLQPVDRIITDIACDLARYALAKDDPTETVIERARHARDLLDAIAGGSLRIGAEPDAGAGNASLTALPRTMRLTDTVLDQRPTP